MLILNIVKFYGQFKKQRGIIERKIKAKFSNEVIKPLEKLDIKEGKEITITIKESASEITKTIKSLRNSFGGWKGLIDAEELKRDIYEDRLINTYKTKG